MHCCDVVGGCHSSKDFVAHSSCFYCCVIEVDTWFVVVPVSVPMKM